MLKLFMSDNIDYTNQHDTFRNVMAHLLKLYYKGTYTIIYYVEASIHIKLMACAISLFDINILLLLHYLVVSSFVEHISQELPESLFLQCEMSSRICLTYAPLVVHLPLQNMCTISLLANMTSTDLTTQYFIS